LELQGSTIVVHEVIGDSGGIRTFVERARSSLGALALPDSSITYTPAAVSLASLIQRQDQLTGAASKLLQSGVDLVSWGPDIPSNTLLVNVHNLTQSDESSITDEVGAPNLTVKDSPEANRTSRTTDSPPWYGGDLLHLTAAGGSCTSGFSVADSNGVTYDTTAAHCGNGTFKQNGQGYGVTVKWEMANNGIGDSQTVSTYPNSAAGDVFTGTNTVRPVETVDVATQNTGEQFCADGYFTQENCTGIIGNPSMCVHFKDGTTTCGLVYGQSHSFTQPNLVQPGDSGGPVYNYNLDGTLDARGLITGEACDPPGPCPGIYYTQISTPLYFFGLHVIGG
jgi:hypothetical protein